MTLPKILLLLDVTEKHMQYYKEESILKYPKVTQIYLPIRKILFYHLKMYVFTEKCKELK